jgi:hypothetical protein
LKQEPQEKLLAEAEKLRKQHSKEIKHIEVADVSDDDENDVVVEV